MNMSTTTTTTPPAPESLDSDHLFSYETVLQSPKLMPRIQHKGVDYEIMHTGGFLRLYTYKCRVYWAAQNATNHLTPDWKIHFSIAPQDIPRAWNILAFTFLESGCHSGIKVVMRYETNGEKPEPWPLEQRGREITLYIFTMNSGYSDFFSISFPQKKKGNLHAARAQEQTHDRANGQPEEIPIENLELRRADEHSSEFWLDFVEIAERRLRAAGIRSNKDENNLAVAAGDFPLGEYASLRNEAFIPIWSLQPHDGSTQLNPQYPPNEYGWNAAQHRIPLPLSYKMHGSHLLRSKKWILSSLMRITATLGLLVFLWGSFSLLPVGIRHSFHF